jgi:hypothetical protein
VSDLNLDLLTINADAIELIHGSLGVALVGHGHEGVAFLGDVDVGDGPDLGEVVLKDVLGT